MCELVNFKVYVVVFSVFFPKSSLIYKKYMNFGGTVFKFKHCQNRNFGIQHILNVKHGKFVVHFFIFVNIF